MFAFFVTGFNVKEQHYPFTNDFKPVFPKNDSSSSKFNLGTASSSKIETDDAPVSAILSQSLAVSIPVGKQVCCQSGMDSSGEAQLRNGKSRGDGRSRNQLLPRYRPQITDEELQQISSEYPMVVASFMILFCFSMIIIKFILLMFHRFYLSFFLAQNQLLLHCSRKC